MKICMTSSAGGHMNQLLKLLPITGEDVFFITSARHMKNVLKNFKLYYIQDPVRNPWKFFINTLKIFPILLKERPNVVITTGAGLVIPTCLMAKILLGAKIIFIETMSRIELPSRTGKIIYPIADLFIVQWTHLLSFYGKKAVYGTPLI